MTTIGMIYDYLDAFAPFDSQMGFDNSGLLIGSRNREISRVLLALDCTASVARQAAEQGCQLVITHHPVIFRPAKSISGDSVVYRLISNNINVISAHTSYDIAEGGVNTCLAERLGFEGFARPEWLECGVFGELQTPMTAAELGRLAFDRLGGNVRFADGGRPIRRIVIIGGSGGGEVYSLFGRADALITGEADHHEMLDARENGFTVITAGHYETEVISMPPLARRLAEQFPDVEFTLAHETSPSEAVR